MKKVILGILILSSVTAFSAFAGDPSGSEKGRCKFVTWFIPKDEADARASEITFDELFTADGCRHEAQLGQNSEYIIRMTDAPGAAVEEVKYVFVGQNGEREKGFFYHGRWCAKDPTVFCR